MIFTIFLKAFFSLFVIMDSLGNIPFFETALIKVEKKFRGYHIRRLVLVAYALLLIFILGGNQILYFFGISIDGFKIAGGIILMLIGLKAVLNLRFTEEKVSKYSVAVVPIATPLIVGPGTLTTTLILVENYGKLITFFAATANIILVWIIMKKLDTLHKFLGKQGSEIIERLMGLILVALAVDFIEQGIRGYL